MDFFSCDNDKSINGNDLASNSALGWHPRDNGVRDDGATTLDSASISALLANPGAGTLSLPPLFSGRSRKRKIQKISPEIDCGDRSADGSACSARFLSIFSAILQKAWAFTTMQAMQPEHACWSAASWSALW